MYLWSSCTSPFCFFKMSVILRYHFILFDNPVVKTINLFEIVSGYKFDFHLIFIKQATDESQVIHLILMSSLLFH